MNSFIETPRLLIKPPDTIDFESYYGLLSDPAVFHIMRKFKRQGIGSQVAYQCFDRFPGVWEVMVFPGNEGSYRFWRTVIKHYSKQPFTECARQITHFRNKMYNIFQFESGQKS